MQVAKTKLLKKRKQKNVLLVSQAVAAAGTRRAKHAEQRSDALMMIVPNRELVSLVEKRKQLLKDRATRYQQ